MSRPKALREIESAHTMVELTTRHREDCVFRNASHHPGAAMCAEDRKNKTRITFYLNRALKELRKSTRRAA